MLFEGVRLVNDGDLVKPTHCNIKSILKIQRTKEKVDVPLVQCASQWRRGWTSRWHFTEDTELFIWIPSKAKSCKGSHNTEYQVTEWQTEPSIGSVKQDTRRGGRGGQSLSIMPVVRGSKLTASTEERCQQHCGCIGISVGSDHRDCEKAKQKTSLCHSPRLKMPICILITTCSSDLSHSTAERWELCEKSYQEKQQGSGAIQNSFTRRAEGIKKLSAWKSERNIWLFLVILCSSLDLVLGKKQATNKGIYNAQLNCRLL